MMRQQREAAQQVGSSLLSWLNPFSYSWFTWLVVGGLGLLAYTAASKGDGEGGFLGKLFDMLPEWAQKPLAGMFSGVDGDVALTLRAIAKRHGSDGLKTEDYLKAPILFDAMVEQPKAILDIARKLPKGGELDDTGRKAMTAMREIVNDPEKIGKLLNAEHKADTYALLETLSPIAFKSGALGTFIDATAMRDGKVDPAFVQLLNSVLTEGSLSDRIKPQEVATFFRRPGNAKAFGDLLNAVDDAKLTPKMREAVASLRKNWGNLNEGVAEVVADKDSLQFLLALGGQPPSTASKIAGMVPDSIKTAIGRTMPSGVTGLPDKVGENIGQLFEVQQAFKDAGIDMGSAAAAPKRATAVAPTKH